MAGEHDYFHGRVATFDFQEGGKPVHTRHFDIEDDDLHGMRFQHVHGPLPAAGGQDIEAFS